MTINDKPPAFVTFGTDGIRGVAGQYPLDPVTIFHIGRSIQQWLHSAQPADADFELVIGQDTRESGDSIVLALAAGIVAEGGRVALFGVATTPQMAHDAQRQNLVGIMVTASHNPFEQNGIKIFGADGFKLTDQQESDIERRIAALADESANGAVPRMSGAFTALAPYFSVSEYGAFLLRAP